MSGIDQREKVRELERRAEVAEQRTEDQRKAKEAAIAAKKIAVDERIEAEGRELKAKAKLESAVDAAEERIGDLEEAARDEQIRRERVEGFLEEIRDSIGSAAEDGVQAEVLRIVDQALGNPAARPSEAGVYRIAFIAEGMRDEPVGLYAGRPTVDGYRFERIDLDAFQAQLHGLLAAALAEAFEKAGRRK